VDEEIGGLTILTNRPTQGLGPVWQTEELANDARPLSTRVVVMVGTCDAQLSWNGDL
jgi:hypothetical protein